MGRSFESLPTAGSTADLAYRDKFAGSGLEVGQDFQRFSTQYHSNKVFLKKEARAVPDLRGKADWKRGHQQTGGCAA
jgi:D-alanyl-D-alanine dipeptidase